MIKHGVCRQDKWHSIVSIALGQEFHDLEASIAACAKGEYASNVPGSESVAGKLTVHNGTWDNHIAPFQQAEEAKWKYGNITNGKKLKNSCQSSKSSKKGDGL